MWSVVVTPALHKTCLAKYGQHVTAVGRSLDATSDDRTCEIVTLVTTQNMLNMAHQAAGREYQVDYNQCKDSPCFASLLASRFRCLLYLVSTCMLVAPPPPPRTMPSITVLSQPLWPLTWPVCFQFLGHGADYQPVLLPHSIVGGVCHLREMNEGCGQGMMIHAIWSGLSGGEWRLWARHDELCHVIRTIRSWLKAVEKTWWSMPCGQD